MSRVHRRRYIGARRIARHLGISAEMLLRLYAPPRWRVSRLRVVRDRVRPDMAEVEYWLAPSCSR